MKNELILAHHTGRYSPAAAPRLLQLLDEFGLQALKNTRFTLPRDNALGSGSGHPGDHQLASANAPKPVDD
jgi:hypothetical protein